MPDPPGGLNGFDEAVRLALAKVRDADVETRWSTAAWTRAPADPLPTDPDWSGGSVYEDRRHRDVAASADALWRVVEGIGGETGWYSFPLAWSARGWLDRLVGGVGLRRGRRDPHQLRVGEALDFWRVEEIEHGRLLRLRAEMRLPGRAWLELRTVPHGPGQPVRAAGHLRAQRAGRPPLLVGDRARPRRRLRRHGPQHRPRRRTPHPHPAPPHPAPRRLAWPGGLCTRDGAARRFARAGIAALPGVGGRHDVDLGKVIAAHGLPVALGPERLRRRCGVSAATAGLLLVALLPAVYHRPRRTGRAKPVPGTSMALGVAAAGCGGA